MKKALAPRTGFSRMDMRIERFKLFFICFVVFSLLFSTLVYAENGTVIATCVDESGNPLKGVKVEIFSLDNRKVEDKKSNGEGIAELTKIADGVYRVVGRKKDYQPALYEYLTVSASQETVTLKLQPGLDSLLYFEDPARIQRASDSLALGIQAMKANNTAEAEKMLLESIELDPSNSQALFTLGTFYFQMTQFDQAIEILQKAEKLAGMFASLPAIPGQHDPSQQKQFEENARKLIDAVPEYKAELAIKQKKYDVAVEIYTGILQKDPNNPDVHYQMAVALTYAGDLEKAMGEIDKAIELKPDDKDYPNLKSQISARIENAAIAKAQAALDEGTGLLKLGKAAEALEKFRSAISLLKEDKQAPVWRQIGIAQAELKQADAAEEAFKKAVDLAPANEINNYLNNLAQFYLESKMYDQALDTLTDPRTRGDKSADQVLMDIVDRTKNNNPGFAKIVLERILKANPENQDACFLLGELYYIDYSDKDMDARARELLTQYIENGQDPEKVNKSKNMLVLINRRSQ
ncbi:MAG: tetratricopeptide repeat protein [Acidobacteria bacterium]|nr:tetratricopeptide repeat protein [Acidobacteriota bacterium]